MTDHGADAQVPGSPALDCTPLPTAHLQTARHCLKGLGPLSGNSTGGWESRHPSLPSLSGVLDSRDETVKNRSRRMGGWLSLEGC